MIQIEVEVRNGYITNVAIPDGVSVHCFDYNARWGKEIVEADEKGIMCKQTIWQRQQSSKEGYIKVQVYIRDGIVFRVVIPTDIEVIVKAYGKKDTEPKVQKWMRAQKSA